MNRPQIGIPLTLDDRGRWREGRSYHYIDRNYADAISRAGGLPLQLPVQPEAEAIVATLAGLLLPGGDDFPADGDLPKDVSLDLVSPEQLTFDEALFEAASARGIPIFGICYGMQLMGRMRGATLYSHLPSGRPDAECHKLSPEMRHPISIERTSLLAKILGRETEQVNSLHQQAIRSVGPAHQVVATSSDGVIEAIERRASPEHLQTQTQTGSPVWELGVQWHPEKMADPSSERLFLNFVEACRAMGGNR